MRFLIDSLVGLVLIALLLSVLLIHRRQQRLLIDGLIALLLVGVLASAVPYFRERQRWNEQYISVQRALARLYEQATYHGVMQVHEVRGEGELVFPATISPMWFAGEGLPVNVAVPGRQPWLDIAPLGDFSDHPPDPVVTRADQAGIWYNPNRGIFRARVMSQWTEAATVELYNKYNDTTLKKFTAAEDRSRKPRPLFAMNQEMDVRTAVPTAPTLTPRQPQGSNKPGRATLIQDSPRQ